MADKSGDNNYVYNFVCSWWLYDWLETKNKRLLWGALTGFLYFMILALISFIVGNVDEINIYDMIKTALICVTSGCAGSFFSS